VRHGRRGAGGRLPKLLAEWAEAIVANDPARIAEFMEPDWTLVTPESGQISADRFLAVVTSGELTHSRMSFEVVGLRRLGDVTVVVAHGTNAGSWQGQPFEADEWVTDVFVRRDGRWRCSVSALTPNHSSPLHVR
jgi:uncharacterized protein (TIGR02246 family)